MYQGEPASRPSIASTQEPEAASPLPSESEVAPPSGPASATATATATPTVRVARPTRVRRIDPLSAITINLDDRGGREIFLRRSQDGPSQRLEIRNGSTGSLMWSKDVPGFFQTVFGALLGPDGRPGIVVPSSPGGDESRMQAFDGSGRELWSRAWTPTGTPVSAAAHLLPGDAEDFVVTSRRDTPQGALFTVDVVDGATGAIRTQIEQLAVRHAPEARVVEDMSGDGFADVAISGDELVAYEGRTGRRLWAAAGAGAPRDAGDVDADGYADLLISPSKVLSGRTGRTIMTLPSDRTVAVGDVNADTRDDVVAVLTRQSRGEFCGVYEAHGVRGRLYRRTNCVRHNPDHAGQIGVEEQVGDVDADGVRDWISRIEIHDPATAGCGSPPQACNPGGAANVVSGTHSVVSGRTGRVLWNKGSEWPLQTPLADPGDDMATSEGTRHALIVRAMRGSSGERQWEGRCEAPADNFHNRGGYDAGDMTGDGRGDLLCILESTSGPYTQPTVHTRVSALNGTTGRVLWSFGVQQ